MLREHRESIVADIVKRCSEELDLWTSDGKSVLVGGYSVCFECSDDVVLVHVRECTDDNVDGYEVSMSYDVAYSRIASLIRLIKAKDEADKLSDFTFGHTLQYIGSKRDV